MMSVRRMLPSNSQMLPVMLNRMGCYAHQRMAKSTHHVEVGENRSVAYKQMPGTKQPTIVHVPGLHSYAHMNGMTAKSILRYDAVELKLMKYKYFYLFCSPQIL